MYNKEIKRYNFNIFKDIKEIDKLLIDIKINMHDLEKLGKDKSDMEKDMDLLGVAFYKLKDNFNKGGN